jgi:hypothetical protein
MKVRDEASGERSATGTVARLTTAPKGEIDGAELENGTVIHWPPHLEDHFAAVVRAGGRVRAVGEEKEKKHGTVLEVRTVTDLATNESRSRDDAPPHHSDSGPAGQECRLRALEEKVETLASEVKRLGGKV